MADTPMIDPELHNSSQAQPQSQAQPRGDPTLPFHDHNLDHDRDRDEHDEASDGDGNDANAEKRRKLNLLKCRQCRDARKKVDCFITYPSSLNTQLGQKPEDGDGLCTGKVLGLLYLWSTLLVRQL